MMTERRNTQLKMYTLTMEDMVPEGHFLRKLDKAVDFSFIYDEVRELYSAVGRPSIDPIVLIKSLLLGYLYGIQSERYLEMEIQVNIAFRWFLRLDLDESVPDHSTMSQNRRRRFNGTPLFRKIFERVLAECIAKGLVDGKLIVTDSTHVKANASPTSAITVEVEKEASAYMDRLDKYEAEERAKLEAEGKIKPKKSRRKDMTRAKSEKAVKTVYATDPEAGKLARPGKPIGAHYLDHQSIDAKNGIIVDVAVTPGNTNDNEPYLNRIAYIQDNLGIPIEAVAADSAYDTSLIHQELEDKGIMIFTPERTDRVSHKVEFQRKDFQYNESADNFTCPHGQSLNLRHLSRFESVIAKVYQGESKVCRNCPSKDNCLAPSHSARRITVNIFENTVKSHHDHNGSPAYHAALKARQIWCEGTFATQKRMHNLRQMLRVGLEAAHDHCLLSATAINLKRMIKCELQSI